MIELINIPREIAAAQSLSALYVRSFGIREGDLGIDFDLWPPPLLVTAILRACVCDQAGQPVTEEFLWDLTIKNRLALLLRIVFLSAGHGLWAVLACGREDCAEKIEIEIQRTDLAPDLAFCALEKVQVDTGREIMEIECPRGRHQLQWMQKKFEDETQAVAEMMHTLIKNDQTRENNTAGQENNTPAEQAFTEPAFPAVIEAFKRYDPLTAFELAVICPYCRTQENYEIDLQVLAFKELKEIGQNLLADVHQLARHYHWSEKEIMALPAWRRRKYLGFIEGAGGEQAFFSS